MGNWKITKRDMEALIKLQRKIDAIRQRYVQKYGESEYGEANSSVAICLDCAAASIEEIYEHQK